MQHHHIVLQKSRSQRIFLPIIVVADFILLLIALGLLVASYRDDASTVSIQLTGFTILLMLMLPPAIRMAALSRNSLHIDGTVLSERRGDKVVWQIDLNDVTRLEGTKPLLVTGILLTLVTKDNKRVTLLPVSYTLSERLKLAPVLAELAENPSIEKADADVTQRALDTWFQKDAVTGELAPSKIDPSHGRTKEQQAKVKRIVWISYAIFMVVVVVVIAVAVSKQQ